MNVLESAVYCNLIYSISNDTPLVKNESFNFQPTNDLESKLFKNILNPNLKYFKGTNFDGEVIITNTIDNENLIIGFKGTNTLKDWEQDFDFLTTEIETGTKLYVHEGFLRQYNEIQNFIELKLKEFEGKKIFICGHSLGGGLSVICGYFCKKISLADNKDYDIHITTFGSPRACDINMEEWYLIHIKNFTRVVNNLDIICNLPPSGRILKFKHINEIVVYFKNHKCLNYVPKRTLWDRIMSLWTKSVAHEMDIYIDHIQKYYK